MSQQSEQARHEAHDLLLDCGQRLRCVIDVPKFNLVGPGRETLPQQRQVLSLLQCDDPIGAFEVVCSRLRWRAGAVLVGTNTPGL